MLKPKGDRVGLCRCTHFVHETLVSKGILDAQRRAQRPGEERRRHGMRHNTLAPNASGAATLPANTAGNVGWHGVRAIAKLASWFCRCTWCYGLWRVSEQQPGNDVTRAVVAGPAPSRRYPVFAVPSHDGSALINAGTLLDDTSGAEVLPRHFIHARKLYTN